VIKGAIILESLREDARIGDMGLVVRELYRFRPDVTAPGLPGVWSVIEFEGPESCADQLAESLASTLSDQQGWCVEFRSQADTFIAFRGKHFRYPRGDEQGRAEAQQYGRTVGVPESQLDWPA
jgi:hypothetical protein